MRMTFLLFDGFTALDVVGGYEVLAGEATARLIQFGIEYYPDPPFGNGSPDEQPAAAKAVIRRVEQTALQRLAARRIPF